jgi:MFS family permease
VIWIRHYLGKTAVTNRKQSFAADLREGIKAFSQNKGVVNLVLTTTLVLFFVGLLQALIIPMLLSLTTAKAVGISQSVCASGMIFGSLFIGLFGGKNNLVKTLSISLLLSGMFFANLGLSTNIIYITMAGFMFFATLPFINTSIEVMIRTNIDSRKQGRVWSIISMITYLGSIIAFTVAGFLADKVFNPLLESGGLLADTAGTIIGTGEGRGIALLFVISGLALSMTASLIWRDNEIRELAPEVQPYQQNERRESTN